MLKHPNIIYLEGVFESDDLIYIVLERMNGGELFDYVVNRGTLSEEETSSLVPSSIRKEASQNERVCVERGCVFKTNRLNISRTRNKTSFR